MRLPRTRPGRSVALLAAAVLLAARAGAQTAWPATPEQRLHAAAVRAERTSALETAWLAADATRREACLAYLRAERGAGEPAGRRPDPVSLAGAVRVLGGAGPEAVAGDALARLADALDLQVVPGAYLPEPGRPESEPLRVRVYLLEESAFQEDVVVRLDWRLPDGSTVRARREPIAREHFHTPGFDMYVRAPLPAAGTAADGAAEDAPAGSAPLLLVPTLECGGRAATGVPVPVLTRARADALPDRGDPYGEGGLLERGARDCLLARERDVVLTTLPGLTDPDRLARLRVPPPPDPPGSVATATAVLVLLPPEEHPAAPFAGPRGVAWSRLAAGVGTLDALPFAPDRLPVLAAWVAARRAEGARRVVLVALDDAAVNLALALHEERLEVDRIALSSSLAAPPKSLPAVPVLLVGPRAEAGEAAPERVRAVRDATPGILRELDVPAAVADWLRE